MENQQQPQCIICLDSNNVPQISSPFGCGCRYHIHVNCLEQTRRRMNVCLYCRVTNTDNTNNNRIRHRNVNMNIQMSELIHRSINSINFPQDLNLNQNDNYVINQKVKEALKLLKSEILNHVNIELNNTING
jgi:hypothetical protein